MYDIQILSLLLLNAWLPRSSTWKGEIDMANQTKNKKSGSWKKERASVSRRTGSKPRSNKYSPGSDTGKRPAAGTAGRYWRAGYTRKDGTKVRGHYVTKSPG
jgi:hypothetical protein